MFEFTGLDLPLIWAAIIGAAVVLYVLLDGFDLGLGILFPLVPEERHRATMLNSIAPFWDGNETWLVLGGGGLFAAFPLAYAVLMPAVYMPVGFMLTALIFRGVAFEFRFKAGPTGRRFWDQAFHWGSAVAAFSQGLILAAFIRGVAVEDNAFAGSVYDALTPFGFLVGGGVVAGYALLGACWLVIKTEGRLQAWARDAAVWLTLAVLAAMAAVSLWVPFLAPEIAERWGVGLLHGGAAGLDLARALLLAPIPLATLALAALLVRTVRATPGVGGATYAPFLCAVGLFLLGFAGLAISLFPYAVPRAITIWEAAAAPNALSLMLVGVAVMLPVILAYTAYVYWVFRGKVADDEGYH